MATPQGAATPTTAIQHQSPPSSEDARRNSGRFDPEAVGWDRPDDLEDPMNWPTSRKAVNIGLMSLLTIISPLGSSMFAPGVAQLMAEFNSTSKLLATFVVSIYILGYAFGPLLWAPLSEIYGRVYMYHIGNSVFVILCIGAALSKSMGTLLTLRLFMGIFGSAPTTVGIGSIMDTVTLEWRGRILALWAMGPLLGPCIGPVIGGHITEGPGWRWVYWFLAILGGVLGICGMVLMRETYAPAILERKARHLRKTTNNPSLRNSLGTRDCHLVKLAMIRPLKLLFKAPLVAVVSLYVSVAYGTFNLLIATFSFVYAERYHFNEETVGLSFIPLGIGMTLGVGTYGYLSDLLVRKAKERQGSDGPYQPEVKLSPWVTVPVGVALPGGLLMYGWTIQYGVHWIVPMISVAIFSFSLMGATMFAYGKGY
ncbi:hypothetical protein FAVG1_12083 [Fusarium avenaceum]|nr:hypothetical protein FAVG1_12083 [Fusarium avenaceum]